MNQIVWLASYPKSGNTWLRVFLSNYLRNDSTPADINALELGSGGSARGMFDGLAGAESSDMTPEEVDLYRPDAYRRLCAEANACVYLKVHDAYTLNEAGDPVIPADVTRGAIYVVRNPLDIVVSYAHGSAVSTDAIVERLALETTVLEQRRDQLRQRLLSWSAHVLSWLDQNALPVHLVRYEDLSARPDEAFGQAVRFLGLEVDVDRIKRCVAFSSFEVLQQQEMANGFKERSPKSPSFFRKGRPGDWRAVLSEGQIARVIRDHGATMQRLGYLSADGSPL